MGALHAVYGAMYVGNLFFTGLILLMVGLGIAVPYKEDYQENPIDTVNTYFVVVLLLYEMIRFSADNLETYVEYYIAVQKARRKKEESNKRQLSLPLSLFSTYGVIMNFSLKLIAISWSAIALGYIGPLGSGDFNAPSFVILTSIHLVLSLLFFLPQLPIEIVVLFSLKTVPWRHQYTISKTLLKKTTDSFQNTEVQLSSLTGSGP